MMRDDLSITEQAALLSGASEWESRANERAGVPAFVMSDGPHGVRRQLGSGDHLGLGESKPATCFPTAGTVANSWDPVLVERMGRALGREAHDLDVNILLGPGMNIKRNPLCGRNFEYFSEDPIVSGRMAAGLITGVQSQGVGACPKHFAVNSQELRRQSSNSVVDERTMRELYLTAFEIAVREAKPWSVMTSYNRVNGVYAHENAHLLQDILRKEWGFDGMVVSDWGGSNSAVAAVRAGGSLEMPSPGYTSVRELVAAVHAGTLSKDDVERRAREVATTARRTGGRQVDRNGVLRPDVIDAHHDIARQVAEASDVLLKNDGRVAGGSVLPLKRGTRVAIIGDMAKIPRFQGSGSSKVNATRSESLLDQFMRSSDVAVAGYRQGYERRGAPNTVLLDDAVALAVDKGTDVVVVVIELDERSESEGLDRSTMAIPQPQVDLIGALHATGKPIVAVLAAGSPVQTSWIDDADAVLYVGLSGQAGASAAVRILTGEVNPSGSLAETWPIDYADCPSAAWYPADGPDAIYREGPFVGYRYYRTADIPVCFPFGYGLSYASFSFGALSVNDDGVSFTVMNTSDVEGATVAQLYVRGPQGGVLRPDRELKGFIKVRLAAHERRVVHIDFDQYTFRHYDPTVQRWCTESGSWTVMVGEDCDHDRLRAQFTVEGDVEPVPADPALGAYLTGRVKDATDDELATLFRGHVPLTSPSSVFGVNDPIVSWQHSRGLVARAVARTLVRREARISRKKGAPDLDTLFVLNMPPRAMSKMTGGLVDGAMVDAIVLVANGHAVRGLGAFVVAYLRNRSAPRNIAKELHHD